jgi:hypothetical protein
VLSVQLRPGTAQVERIHCTTSPLVYLDQWGWRWLARDLVARAEFLRLLKESGGTLAFSEINLVEFGGLSDRGLLQSCEELLELARPNVAFTDFDPEAVTRREDEMQHGSTGVVQPFLSDRLLEQLDRFDDTRLDPLCFRGFITRVLLKSGPGGLRPAAEILVKALARGVTKGKVVRDTTVGGKKEIQSGVKGELFRWPTRHVYTAACYNVVKSNLDLTSVNHGMDFFHMIVPISCCDVVLLDSAWAETARQIQRDLKKKSLLSHEATVISGKTRDEIWKTLETHRSRKAS